MKRVRLFASSLSFAMLVALAIGCNPTPNVTAIDPSSGPETGGTEVTITGSNIQKGATAKFGDADATVSEVTPTSIKATSPAGAVGTVEVKVVNPKDKASTTSAQFTYMDTTPPAVANTDPTADATLAEGAEQKTITVTFSEAVQAATVDIVSEPLPDNKKGKPGSVTGETTVLDMAATWTTAEALKGGFKYTATITGTDTAGNASQPATVSFTVPAPAKAPARKR